MLVTMPWRRQISASVVPGSSDSVTRELSSSVKRRRLARPALGGSLIGLSLSRCFFVGGRSDERASASLSAFCRRQSDRASAASCTARCRGHTRRLASPCRSSSSPASPSTPEPPSSGCRSTVECVACGGVVVASCAAIPPVLAKTFAPGNTFNQRRNVFSPRRCWRQYLRIPRPLLCHAST